MPIQWDNRPPNRKWCGIRIVSVPANSSLAFVLLGDVLGVWTHWVPDASERAGGRTRPCIGDHCPHCAARIPTRWRGYIQALMWTSNASARWTEVVLELTESAALFLDGRELRGLGITASRAGKLSHVRLRIEDAPARGLPPLPDVRPISPILERMWGSVPDAGSERHGEQANKLSLKNDMG